MMMQPLTISARPAFLVGFVTAMSALVATTGCDERATTAQVLAPLESAVPNEPIGALGRTELEVFASDGTLVAPTRDSDGDGISDAEELEGWRLTLDPDGWASFLASGGVVPVGGTDAPSPTLSVTATSDPRYADSDGDGLSDGEERVAQSDPRKWDTDGDGLTDLEEVRQFSTNPSRADSDNDATGGDPTRPLPPLPALLDGAELRLELGPDGLRRAGPGATNPAISDTDGDGVNDYHELLSGTRNPVVAEVPQIAVIPSPGAQIELYLNTETTDSRIDRTTNGVTTTLEESGSTSMEGSQSITLFSENYAGVFTSGKVSGGCCFNFGGVEAEVGARYRNESRISHAMSLTFGATLRASMSEVQTEAFSKERSQGISVESGTIRLSVDLMNTGPVAASLSDVAIGLSRWDLRTRRYAPVTELVPLEDELGVLAPGDRRTLIVSDTDVPIDAMKALMTETSRIHLTAARFTLQNAQGRDFDFVMDDVEGSTITLRVDTDELGTTRVVRVAPAELSGTMTMRALLEAAGLDDFEATRVTLPDAEGTEVWSVRIGERGTEFHSGAAPDLSDPLPYVATAGPGERWVKRGWFVQVERFDPANERTFFPNMLDTIVHIGDEVWLQYSEDLDRDGVPAFLERELGSSDADRHSDSNPAFPNGDGLSDFFEAFEPWEVAWDGRVPYRVFGSPGTVDVDGDGLDDRAERENGTDPWLADTDFDGLSDGVEVALGGDPTSTLAAEAQAPVVLCEVARVPVGNDQRRAAYHTRVEVTDAQGDLLSVVFESQLAAGTYTLVERAAQSGVGDRWEPQVTIAESWSALALGQNVVVETDEDGFEHWTVTPTDRIAFEVATPTVELAGSCVDRGDRPPFPMSVTAVDRGGHKSTTPCIAVGLLDQLGCLD